jgi:predicted transcriptional regulator
LGAACQNIVPELGRRTALLLAVKPRWAEMLLARTKTVEFRRRGPGPAALGRPVLIYASSPVCAIVGYGTSLECVRAKPSDLWNHYANHGGIDEQEFAAYFAGAIVGDALRLECSPLPNSVKLDLLRSRYNWRPPMSWSWLPAASPLLSLVAGIGR